MPIVKAPMAMKAVEKASAGWKRNMRAYQMLQYAALPSQLMHNSQRVATHPPRLPKAPVMPDCMPLLNALTCGTRA